MYQANELVYIKQTITEAKKAYSENEVPVGAIIVNNQTNEIISRSHNLVEKNKNPLMHAEIIAITDALKKLNTKYLYKHSIFVSLEPCPMCAHAISIARLDKLYFSAYDIKSGGVDNGAKIFNSTSCHHKPEVYGGILEIETSKYMQSFFKNKRKD